jgi:hypothetical protein
LWAKDCCDLKTRIDSGARILVYWSIELETAGLKAFKRELNSLNGLIGRILISFAASQLVWGCASLDESMPALDQLPIGNQRVSLAFASLNALEEVDAYIKLDNSPLKEHIRDRLIAQATETEDLEFSRIKVHFKRQVIELEATLQIPNGSDDVLNAALGGDVILTFSGNQLIWLPHFDQLKVSDSVFVSDRQSIPGARVEYEERLLGRVNREIADAVIVLGKNVVPINPLPLGQIEVGAALTNFPDVAATNTHALGGVFTVAGSAILVEPAVTSIAVNLGFIPNISDCPADLVVSRSTFAREIRNREPFGITRLLDEKAATSHFFTEITGATRSTAVIHYWFADGQPVQLEELAVEPSFRWRTWSSMTIDPKLARNWEVIVVEKETGCILHSLAILANPDVKPEADSAPAEAVNFTAFRDEFERRVSGFSISSKRPDVAFIEVSRPFLRDALHASLKDIQILVDFETGALPVEKLSANLGPFNADDIVCSERQCESRRECNAGFTQCTRQRDSRDCTTCLFHNPLNNRCVKEGTDPICEAAKTAQNTGYEFAREACVEQEAAARQDCERLRSQELRSCEIEAASEQSACEASRTAVQEFSDAASFAGIALDVRASGGLAAVFSDFEIEGDLAGLRQDLRFSAALELSGAIRFAPRKELGPVADCIDSWQKSFESVVVLHQLPNSMIGSIVPTETALITEWTGHVVAASISPAPIEAMFVENPSLLADCQIGLTVDKVAAAVTGDAGEYITGHYLFEIQPTPSRIDLGQASVVYGETIFRAKPQLSPTHLKYEVKK